MPADAVAGPGEPRVQAPQPEDLRADAGAERAGGERQAREVGPHRRPREDHGADAGHRRPPRHHGPGPHGEDGARRSATGATSSCPTAATWRCTTTRRRTSTGSSASCATWMRGAPLPRRDDFEAMLARVDAAQLELQNGRAAAFKALWSHADDVTLSGGFGGTIEKGWEAIGRRLDWVGTQFSNGTHYPRAHRFQRRRRPGIRRAARAHPVQGARDGDGSDAGLPGHDAFPPRARGLADHPPPGRLEPDEAARTIGEGRAPCCSQDVRPG